MALRVRRLALVSVLTAFALIAAVSVSLWSVSADVPYLTPVFLAASLVPLGIGLVTDRHWLLVPGVVLAAGVVAVLGGLLANGAVCRQPVADRWSLAYAWRANVIRFGPTTTAAPLCRAEPNRLLVALGYLLASVGAYDLSLGRVEDGLLTNVSKRVRKQWNAEN